MSNPTYGHPYTTANEQPRIAVIPSPYTNTDAESNRLFSITPPLPGRNDPALPNVTPGVPADDPNR
jgi:hypothetical protein